jgi:putative DNA methylase
MAWDYTEIDPFGDGPGNWGGAVDWIRRVIEHCSTAADIPARVRRADAQDLPFEDASFDAVAVDPPYYDAFQYGDLSDFFYVWLKRTVGHLHPELFAIPLTPKRQEIIENRADKESDDYISPDEYEQRLRSALAELRRVVKPEGVLSLVFAHTDVKAWELLLNALRAAGLLVTTSWPMRSEMSNRSTARISAVLDSSVVLVCRPAEPGREGFYDDVVSDLRVRIRERLEDFEELDLVGADYFVSAIGPAFEVFAQYDRVRRLSGDEVGVDELMVLARRTVAEHAMAKLLGGQTLTGLDDTTLFYLTWRWSYGTQDLPADETYMLERAFDVDLDVLGRNGGVIDKMGSNFRLLGPDDRVEIDVQSAGLTLIDIMHRAAQLWDAGRRNELTELLGATGAADEAAFWAAATALTQVLPDGDRERTMLLGLTGNQDGLARAAADASAVAEPPTLFDD